MRLVSNGQKLSILIVWKSGLVSLFNLLRAA